MRYSTGPPPPPPFLFLIMAGRLFLKRAPNHKPPIQFQMLVHGTSLIEIGACFKNDLPAIIRNKEGADTVLAPDSVP